MFCHTSICLFFLVSAQVIQLSAGGDACRNIDFLPVQMGKRLTSHVIKNTTVDGMEECSIKCFLENACVSYNLAPGVNGKHSCELSDSDQQNHPHDLVQEDGYAYQESENPCRSSPCPASSRCLRGFGDDGYTCVCPPGYSGAHCEDENPYGSQPERAGKSCKDIKDRTSTSKNKEYWITANSAQEPFKVFCDMTTDGGGWTLIKRTLVPSEGEAALHVKAFGIQDYRGISNYTLNHQVVPSDVLRMLREDMGFDQLRFYCFKKAVGRVFHIKTALNDLGEAVVHSFTMSDFSEGDVGYQPTACDSFEAFSDDTSILSRNCSRWGEKSPDSYEQNSWGRYSTYQNLRMYNFLAGIRNLYTVRMRYFYKNGVLQFSCDDEGTSLSEGDTWQVFVR